MLRLSQPLLSVVVPTYNERDNVAPLLERLTKVLDGVDYEVVFVDDNSPDGTAKVIEDAAKVNPRVRLLLRTNRKGLATAILDGIGASRGKYVVVMDADLQHPPEVVAEMVRAAEGSGADIVVASRYAKGGRTRGWSPLRRLISWGATVISRLLVPESRRTSDPMSGFFLIRRDRVSLEGASPTGYKALLEILYRNPQAKVVEVPYTFMPRERGKSKLGTKVILEYLWHVIKISRPVRFALVGGVGTGVNEGVAALVLYLLGNYTAAFVGGIEVSILSNFALNDLWTFRDRRSGRWYSRLLRYHVMVAPAGLTIFFVAELLAKMFHVYALLALFIGILAGFVANYTLSSRNVWRFS
ncbi:MAG: glycosyltransferase family 2 protein [Acidilobus sp.]